MQILIKFKLNVHRVLYKLSMYMYADLIKFKLNVHRVLYKLSMYMYADLIKIQVKCS